MPRAFSSGALSIESKLENETEGLLSARYFVIAAVSVVLPWSTWPIVPTFTCGLVRSYIRRAICLLLRSARLVAGVLSDRVATWSPHSDLN